MRYYTYDPQTHVFIGQSADFDPNASVAIPLNSTTVAPPNTPPIGVYRLIGNGWIDVNPASIPAQPLPQPPIHLPIPMAKIDFLKHLLATGVTLANVTAARNDTTMAGNWVFFDAVDTAIHKDDPLTTQLMATISAAGYVTADQLASFYATWPVA